MTIVAILVLASIHPTALAQSNNRPLSPLSDAIQAAVSLEGFEVRGHSSGVVKSKHGGAPSGQLGFVSRSANYNLRISIQEFPSVRECQELLTEQSYPPGGQMPAGGFANERIGDEAYHTPEKLSKGGSRLICRQGRRYIMIIVSARTDRPDLRKQPLGAAQKQLLTDLMKDILKKLPKIPYADGKS